MPLQESRPSVVMIHVLMGGQPLCRFSAGVPRDWPEGHVWVNYQSALTSEVDEKLCEGCRHAWRREKRI